MKGNADLTHANETAYNWNKKHTVLKLAMYDKDKVYFGVAYVMHHFWSNNDKLKQPF